MKKPQLDTTSLRGFFRFFLACFSSLAATATAEPPSLDEAELTRFIESALGASDIPGAAVVVCTSDEVIYAKAFGVADASGSPVTVDTPFQIGSISKSFVGLVFAQLEEEGRLSLDAPVTDSLPDLQGRFARDWERVSIRHLLTHTSGLSTFDGNRFLAWSDQGPESVALAVRTIASRRPAATPGEVYEYSNANYLLAGAILESVLQCDLEDIIADRIFSPLGMKNSSLGGAVASKEPIAEPFLQWFGINFSSSFRHGRATMAPGGGLSSAADMARYLQALMAADGEVVSKSIAERVGATNGVPTSRGERYGLGWFGIETPGATITYHGGLVSGFVSNAAFSRELGLCVVVLTNLTGAQIANVP
ncbi:MAG: serine hydrolase domain-containing protein, partial [Planctomycetota bacterium]